MNQDVLNKRICNLQMTNKFSSNMCHSMWGQRKATKWFNCRLCVVAKNSWSCIQHLLIMPETSTINKLQTAKVFRIRFPLLCSNLHPCANCGFKTRIAWTHCSIQYSSSEISIEATKFQIAFCFCTIQLQWPSCGDIVNWTVGNVTIIHILSSPHEARCEVYMLTHSPTMENIQVRAKPRNSNYLCHPDSDS